MTGIRCRACVYACSEGRLCQRLQGLQDVYTGGRSANDLENSVERALTRRDVHGRVLTPKQAFRDLCHKYVSSCFLLLRLVFAGLFRVSADYSAASTVFPATCWLMQFALLPAWWIMMLLSAVDVRQCCCCSFHGIFPSKSNQERQMQKDAETATAKRAATSENPASLRRLQAAQKLAAAPYVVLSGSVRIALKHLKLLVHIMRASVFLCCLTFTFPTVCCSVPASSCLQLSVARRPL